MKNFEWQHIEFTDGSNPYICTTKREFERMKLKYHLVFIKEGFWKAIVESIRDLFAVEMEED